MKIIKDYNKRYKKALHLLKSHNKNEKILFVKEEALKLSRLKKQRRRNVKN